MIEDNYDVIYVDVCDVCIGLEDVDIVIVEFVDYKCFYCCVVLEWVDSVIECYGDCV